MTRRHLWTAAKVVATVVLVFLVVRRIDLAGTADVLVALRWWQMAVAGLLTYAAVWVSAWRWRRVLVGYLDERVGWLPLFGDTLVGTTYNLLLPTSVGGDVIRSIRCSARLSVREHGWASVAFERIMGLVSLALVSAIGIAVGSDQVRNELLLVSLGLAGALIAVLVVAPAPLRWAARGLARFERAARALVRTADALAGPLSSWPARSETFAWSLAYQLVSLTILYAVASHWPGVSWSAIYLGVPIALILSTLPITIGGLGLREGLFVAVLVPFGVSPERALALSIIWLASSLLAALTGLLILLTTPSPSSAGPDLPG